ncbi:unnamed protein product [Malus baccata var. baccata]
MPQSTIICGTGMDVYLMKISIGMPPVQILGIVDIGSDLTWIKRENSTQCYQQKAPLFDPKISKTYKKLSSHSIQYEICHYHVTYGDSSHIRGVISTDKITFGSATRQPVSFPQTISGCGLNNSDKFYEEAAGMVGLGCGLESLISRMGSSIDGKFSYCLVDETKPKTTSKMNFSSLGIVSGFGMLSNPLFSGEPKSCYCLRLEAMSLGHTRLQYNTTSSFLVRCFTGTRRMQCYHRLQDYNDILPEDFYNKLESTVSKAIKLKCLTGEFLDLGLCYNTTSVIKAPIITVHFNQENIKLKALNTLMRMSMDVRNFLMSYDLKKGTVSFKPTDCTKH